MNQARRTGQFCAKRETSKMPRSPRLAHKVAVMQAMLPKTFTRPGWHQWLSLATRNRRHLVKLHDDTVNLTWSIIIAHERITWHCRTSYLGGIGYESEYYGTINTRPTLFSVRAHRVSHNSQVWCLSGQHLQRYIHSKIAKLTMKVRTRVNKPYAFLSKYSSLSVGVNCIGSASVRAHLR